MRIGAFALVLGLIAAAPQMRDDAAPAGKAIIAGVVLAADSSNQPIRRALVTISGDGLRQSRTAITDDDGRFVLDRLPAARVTLTASKAAYLTTSFGARRPGRPGTTIRIVDGERRDVTIRLTRGAVISGAIRDEHGMPLTGVQVMATRPGAPEAAAPSPFTDLGWASTDDRGVYRLFGLEPGEYLVFAVMRRNTITSNSSRRSELEMDAVLASLQRRGPPVPLQAQTTNQAVEPPAAEPIGYPVMFYPGTSAIEYATRVTVAAAEERGGVDFPLMPVRLASISGTVVAGDGLPLGTGQMSINYGQLPVVSLSGARPVLSQPPGADGVFRYTQVPPGRYTIMVRSRPGQGVGGRGSAPPGVGRASGEGPLTATASDAVVRYGVAEVDVNGQDVIGVTLVLTPGVGISGRVTFEGSTPVAPDDVARVLVSLAAPSRTGAAVMNNTVVGLPFLNAPPARVTSDGTFNVPGVAPSDYLLRVTLPPALRDKWFLRSAILNGRDLLDSPLEIRNQPIENIAIAFGDRPTGIAGTLTSAAGAPASDYFVVVLPRDRALWLPNSRRIQSARPATDGRFSIQDLPAGEYFLAALTDVEPDDLKIMSFLDQLAAASIGVVVKAGEVVVQDVKIR